MEGGRQREREREVRARVRLACVGGASTYARRCISTASLRQLRSEPPRPCFAEYVGVTVPARFRAGAPRIRRCRRSFERSSVLVVGVGVGG